MPTPNKPAVYQICSLDRAVIMCKLMVLASEWILNRQANIFVERHCQECLDEKCDLCAHILLLQPMNSQCSSSLSTAYDALVIGKDPLHHVAFSEMDYVVSSLGHMMVLLHFEATGFFGDSDLSDLPPEPEFEDYPVNISATILRNNIFWAALLAGAILEDIGYNKLDYEHGSLLPENLPEEEAEVDTHTGCHDLPALHQARHGIAHVCGQLATILKRYRSIGDNLLEDLFKKLDAIVRAKAIPIPALRLAPTSEEIEDMLKQATPDSDWLEDTLTVFSDLLFTLDAFDVSDACPPEADTLVRNLRIYLEAWIAEAAIQQSTKPPQP